MRSKATQAASTTQLMGFMPSIATVQGIATLPPAFWRFLTIPVATTQLMARRRFITTRPAATISLWARTQDSISQGAATISIFSIEVLQAKPTPFASAPQEPRMPHSLLELAGRLFQQAYQLL